MPAHQLLYKRYVKIPLATGSLMAELHMPASAVGLIVFMHGGNRSHFSASSLQLADELNRAQFATLLSDLLTAQEAVADELSLELQFNIELLGQRAGVVLDWIKQDGATRFLPLGIYSTGTGVAAALIAAAEFPETVRAIVARGGRPDLAEDILRAVFSPILMIVGERDDIVLGRNRDALREMAGPNKLEIVRTAGHLFEETGTLEQASSLTLNWFERHISPRERRAAV